MRLRLFLCRMVGASSYFADILSICSSVKARPSDCRACERICQQIRPARQAAKIDFEDETQETFGVGKIEDFRQSQLIDLYACVECGRCTNMCPATGTGKMLSPMDLILRLRDHLTNKGAAITSKTPLGPAACLQADNRKPAGTAGERSRCGRVGCQLDISSFSYWRGHYRRRNLGMYDVPKL